MSAAVPLRPRLAVDIGGTFTDLVLATAERLFAEKVLTTHGDPAEAVLEGVDRLLERSGLPAAALTLVLHGTTLATNALLERRGAATALLTTAGHRDVLAMAFENRFEQYDLSIDRPVPLVPRALRCAVVERVAADGQVLRPLDERALIADLAALKAAGVESVAVGLLHSYRNPLHERRIRSLLEEHWPEVSVSLSSEVCPEIREYERFSTTCANAYVQPLMASYLRRLEQRLLQRGLSCPMLMMTSGGGLTDLETARSFPIRLVESGPAGGAMLAAALARREGERTGCTPSLLSFDMGGTTAKLCLIDDGDARMSRAFEVDRVYRFKRGSGLPVRIPVIEMVELGAGGGSLASVDVLGRIQVGPASAGSEPGPALYGRGGTGAAVTDADALLGRLALESFRAAGLKVDRASAEAAIDGQLAQPLGLDRDEAAFAISEIVAENMAAASRAHAAEGGLVLNERLLVAFGGAAPLHAVRLAQKLGISAVLIPAQAGVGSALGFLLAPIRYEVVTSDLQLLSTLAGAELRQRLTALAREAAAVVAQAAPGQATTTHAWGYCRYAGQGYEIAVPVPDAPADRLPEALRRAFDQRYERLYGRLIPQREVEVLSWTVSVSTSAPSLHATGGATGAEAVAGPLPAKRPEKLYDAALRTYVAAHRLQRSGLPAGEPLKGPLLIDEAHTTTVVPQGWCVTRQPDGALLVQRSAADGAAR